MNCGACGESIVELVGKALLSLWGKQATVMLDNKSFPEMCEIPVRIEGIVFPWLTAK